MASKGVDKENKVIAETKSAVKLVRDSISGSPIIKSDDNRYIYLPHPVPEIREKPEGREQYKRYISRAEYDNVPQFTLDALVGAMFRNPPEISLPSAVDYLVEDYDGDGTSMEEAMQVAAAELLQMYFYGQLTEYSDLAGVDIIDLTVSEAQDMNLRSSVKSYPRDSIVNWGYRNVNGKKTLSFVTLKEVEMVREDDGFEQKKMSSYLVLALDDDGDYYQQKYVVKADSQEDGEWSEVIYPMANGSTLSYIPFEFMFAGKVKSGEVPPKMGYLYPICEKAISRYQTSADMKESMWFSSAPVTTSSGWDAQALEMYEQATGKKQISAGPGAHIPLFNDGSFAIHSWDMANSSYMAYMENNASEIRALGGVFDTTDGKDNQTATAAAIQAAEKSGALSAIAANIEETMKKSIVYAAEFMGQAIDKDQIVIEINRDFIEYKIDAQTITSLVSAYMQGAMSLRELRSNLQKGGLSIEEIESLTNQDQTGDDMPSGEDN